jgi:hypothetical protein
VVLYVRSRGLMKAKLNKMIMLTSMMIDSQGMFRNVHII